MKVYLDNCCFNRPFDDQTQLRIFLETKAKLFIQELITKGELELGISYILEFENNDNPFNIRRETVENFFKFAKSNVRENEYILNIAKEIINTGVKVKDSLHIACAIYSNCDFFLSTDDRLLKYQDKRIIITEPISFIKRWGQ